MANCAFELDQFTADEQRLQVSGRWLGVRGRRFVRPSLTAVVDGHSTRALAELEHKPWAADDGDEWVAAFQWRGPLDDVEEFELAVAPDLLVRLPPPDEALPEAVLPVVAPKEEAAPAQADREPVPARGAAQEVREQAVAVQHNALAVRDRALADLDAAIAMRDGLRAEVDQITADRNRLRGELEQAGDDHERVRRELQRAASERGRLSAELDHVTAERDQFNSERHALEAELGRVRAQLRMAQSDLALARQPVSPPPAPPAAEVATSRPTEVAPSRPTQIATTRPAAVTPPAAFVPALPTRPRTQFRTLGTWSVRALTVALIIAALVLLLIVVLTSGPASVAP